MEEVLYRTIIVGDSCVGKSCLLLKFTENSFKESHDVTLGVEFGTRSISIEGRPIKLQIWDTSGQESFRSITRSFYRRADAVILVFDMTARHTFDHCSHWLEEIKQNSSSDVAIFLAGNQVDLIESKVENSEITQEEALEFVTKNQLCSFIETSAKSGTNVEQLFFNTAKELISRAKDRKETPAKSEKLEIHLTPTIQKKNKKCCSG
jgi:small GTP-binding protein